MPRGRGLHRFVGYSMLVVFRTIVVCCSIFRLLGCLIWLDNCWGWGQLVGCATCVIRLVNCCLSVSWLVFDDWT